MAQADHAPSSRETGDRPSSPVGIEASVAALLRDLVRIPSRAGVDSPDAVFDLVRAWLARRGVASETLTREGRPVALAGRVGRDAGRPLYVLNATVDTAGFGDEAAWSRSPTSGAVVDGWLHGRGSADCKAGVAIFCHLLAECASQSGADGDGLRFVFDAEEHTGGFGGISLFLDRCDAPLAGVLIGYPGFDRVLAGARGFWRTTITVHGAAAHSGSSRGAGTNAIGRAVRLVDALERLGRDLGAAGGGFPLPPKLTVTGMRGGGEFSAVPDRCEVDVDVRLTPAFDDDAAMASIAAALAALDEAAPDLPRTAVANPASWPAYRLGPGDALPAALAEAAGQVLGRAVPVGVAGPSNIGNLLASRGVAATCGFGVAYRNLHAPDECAEVATLGPVLRAYRLALGRLRALGGPR